MMEGINTILNNSLTHHLNVGKAPFQLWEELQEALLPIKKLLDIAKCLKDFEWVIPLDGLGTLPLNVSLVRKSKEEATTLRRSLIPGRIGEKKQQFDISFYQLIEREGSPSVTSSVKTEVFQPKMLRFEKSIEVQSPGKAKALYFNLHPLEYKFLGLANYPQGEDYTQNKPEYPPQQNKGEIILKKIISQMNLASQN
jgi:hypothetical protein